VSAVCACLSACLFLCACLQYYCRQCL
jgi:hypothetical protein